jgi:hypothetical protein
MRKQRFIRGPELLNSGRVQRYPEVYTELVAQLVAIVRVV